MAVALNFDIARFCPRVRSGRKLLFQSLTISAAVVRVIGLRRLMSRTDGRKQGYTVHLFLLVERFRLVVCFCFLLPRLVEEVQRAFRFSFARSQTRRVSVVV